MENFMKHQKNNMIIFFLLFMLPSCSRYVRIFKRAFLGGTENCHDVRAACPYICSLAIYDQGQTVALIDLIWLTEPVRKLYVDLLTQRIGATPEEKKRFVAKECKELQDTIAFYVLMPRLNYDTVSIGCNIFPPWSIILKVNGICYTPCNTIVCQELMPEYMYILGEHFNRYKQPFHVIFSAYGYDGEPIINPCTDMIELIFSSVKYSTSCGYKRNVAGWEKIC